MSTTYKIENGDSFEKIARKVYGSEQYYNLIARANADVVAVLTPGTIITIPDLPSTPQNFQQQIPSTDQDEVAILIDEKRFRFWDKSTITRSVDSMDIIEFGAPFEAEVDDFKKIFTPFSYKPVIYKIGGDTLFTGTMVAVNPSINENEKVVAVSGYSKAGVLNDCSMPASSFPLEFNNQGLRDIASTLASVFGVGVVFDADQGALFERVALEPNKKILTFLADLAQQRNLVISSSTDGKLVFWRSVAGGDPVARLSQGLTPLVSVTPTFSPQDYYSHITGLEPVSIGGDGAKFTVKNPHLNGVLRPLSFKVSDTQSSDLKAATQAKMGRMFANAVAYSCEVSTWRDPQGNLWRPNTTVTLLAPDAMVYSEYEFVIRSVVFDRDAETTVATLNLVLIGSFSGEIPEVLPWEE